MPARLLVTLSLFDLVSSSCASSAHLFEYWYILLVTFIGPVQTVSQGYDITFPLMFQSVRKHNYLIGKPLQGACPGDISKDIWRNIYWNEYELIEMKQIVVHIRTTNWPNETIIEIPLQGACAGDISKNILGGIFLKWIWINWNEIN